MSESDNVGRGLIRVMAYVDPRRRTNHPLRHKPSTQTAIPSDTVIHILISDILLTLSILSAKYWLLARGVGSLWLSINVLAGGGVGALAYLVVKGRVAVRGDIPWKTIAAASAAVFAQQIALFYSSKRLEASRILFIAPFSATVIRHIIRTHSLRSSVTFLAAIIAAILVDANFSTADLYTTITAYIGLIIHGGLQVASSYTLLHLSNSFETPAVSRAVTLVSAAVATIPIHLLGRTVGLLPPYPYVPILALTPLPLLSFVLIHYHPRTMAACAPYSPLPTFKLTFIPTAIFTCILGPLFSRQLPLSDIPFAFLFYLVLQPSSTPTAGSAGMSKSASEPIFRLLQGYLNAILSNSESRKIFYFLVVNLAYMLVQMLYGVWTNSLGLISDAIHMAFDCMAIAMGLFASVMATWKPNERFTYGYGRIETLSGFANGIFLILISVFIVVEAIQRLLDPPQMNTRQLLLVSTVGLAVNLFGMFAMGGHAHHGHSHSHGGGHSHGGESHDDHAHESPQINDVHHGHSHQHEDQNAQSREHEAHHGHSHEQDAHHGHSHDHADQHGHSHDHEDHEDHSHSHAHNESHGRSHDHDNHAHSHAHSRVHARSHSHLTPEIHLESPTDEKKGFLTDSSSAPSPMPASPNPNSPIPFTPVTPSYSFGYDAHLQTHHPETTHSYSQSSHEGHSHNMRGVFLHVMADTLGSVGVIISTILINVYGWTGFDPIASMFIAILIAASVFPLVMDTGRVLALDLGGKEGEVERALQEVSSVYGVQSYSDARFWPLEQGRIVGSIHVQIMPGLLGDHGSNGISGPSRLDRVRDGVEHVLKSRIKGLEELVIQLDG